MHPYLSIIVRVLVCRTSFVLHSYSHLRLQIPQNEFSLWKILLFFSKFPLCIYPLWNRAELGDCPPDGKKTENRRWYDLWGGWYDDKSTASARLTTRGHGTTRFVEIKQRMAQITFVLWPVGLPSLEIRRCEDEVAYQRRRNHSADSVCKTLAHASIIDF